MHASFIRYLLQSGDRHLGVGEESHGEGQATFLTPIELSGHPLPLAVQADVPQASCNLRENKTKQVTTLVLVGKVGQT